MNTVNRFSTPQLEAVHRGKVRDSFRVDASTRLIVATDRLSAFDQVLESCIPGKGAALTRMASFWFDRTRDVFPNHKLRSIGEQAMLVREARPIPLEMVVRAYLSGSAWRAYAAGARGVSGVELPEGLTKNARLPKPIVTPTTKAAHDVEISAREIVERGIVSSDVYRRLEQASLALFEEGARHLLREGLLLVDTKYEFGWIGDGLVLIDEIHTPDSSRFWLVDDYERAPAAVEGWDKEYVRSWLLEERSRGRTPTALPDEIVAETARRYVEVCRRITGESPLLHEASVDGVIRSLVDAGLIRDAFVAIVMGSSADRGHAEAIGEALAAYDLAVLYRVASAHKTPRRVAEVAEELDAACEPGVIIAVAGLSNGLGGALAANVALPVINCPPLRDSGELALHLNSSLYMPSRVPAMTVIGAGNAAQAALRVLGLRRLRAVLASEIEQSRGDIAAADAELRGLQRGETPDAGGRLR